MTMPPNDDDSDLRRLLDDAVSDVHPEGGMDEIRARARRPSAGRWLPLTVAAAVATVAVIGGAAWLAQRQTSAPVAAPGSPPTHASAPAGSTHTAQVPVYYVGATAAGPRLFAETHRVAGTTQSDLQVAVQQALTGSPVDPDYQNRFSQLGVTATASNNDGVVTIDLSEPLNRPPGMTVAAAQVALQALVWTADAAVSGSGPVTFTVAGGRAHVLGIDTAGPVDRASADSVLSTVSVSTPAEGAHVPTQFQVTGQAATFEANVVWELKQGTRVVRHGFTTAQQCCTLSPYTFTVTATPGDYTLVVHDTNEATGEGIGTSQDTKQITVQ